VIFPDDLALVSSGESYVTVHAKPATYLAEFLLKYMVISERQRYRYVANKGTLHLDHIYLDVMRSVIQKLWKL